MWHGFRILTHNPEVSGSLDWLSGQANPLLATNENRIPWGYGFLIPKGAQSESLRVDSYEKSLSPSLCLLGGYSLVCRCLELVNHSFAFHGIPAVTFVNFEVRGFFCV